MKIVSLEGNILLKKCITENKGNSKENCTTERKYITKKKIYHWKKIYY